MTGHIGRRAFITLLGGAAAAWPLASRAQQGERTRRIAILMSTADDAEGQARIAALREGLQQLGWTEGRNLRINTRWAFGDAERMRTFVTEVVQANPEVILANSSPIVAALRQETRSIPIVFAAVIEPVGQGFVANLAHPGSNITGFTNMEFSVFGKMLELLKGMAPKVTRAAAMFNPATGFYVPGYLRLFEASSPSLGIELATAPVHDVSEIEDTVAKLGREPGRGVHHHASQIDHRIDSAAPASRDLRLSLVCRGRRADVLRARSLRHIRARSVLYRPHPSRREAKRASGPAADQIRVRGQSQNGEGARP